MGERTRRVLSAVAAVILLAAGTACSSEPARPDVPLQAGQQTVLFDAMGYSALAVDAHDVLYLGGDLGISKLPPGTTKPAPVGHFPPVLTLTAAPDGTLYFVDVEQFSLEKLASGATSAQTLPFGKLQQWSDIAVGHDGTVYLADNGKHELLTLPSGAAAPTQRPVDGLKALGHMVIDPDNNLYASMGGTIVEIATGSTSAEPVAGAPSTVGGLAADSAGNLYLTDNKAGTVSRMSAGGGDWKELPFSDIQNPTAVAVDGEGNVYVIASQRNKGREVIKLAEK